MGERTTTRALPGEVGLWCFIFTDLVLFALYFALAAWDRGSAVDAFHAGKAELNLTIGMLNTIVLLTGSWAVVMGTRVEAAGQRAASYVYLAAFTGVLFLLLKAVEWHHHLGLGHHISENSFYMWCFFLTGFHALHVIGAVVFLCVIAARLRRAQPSSHTLIEAAGCYWHLVDLLWIGIFLVLYLL
jgi:nitric oxide reductase NorE protein